MELSMSNDPRVLVLDEMRKQTALLERIAAALSGGASATASAPRVDLDGAHGNPPIKAKDPRDWSGPPMTGKRFSECPPEYLDLLAERYEFFANDPTKAEKRRFNELDAARARGWAARLRAGWTAPAGPAKVDETQTEPVW
jgi:hypothetical protein